MKLKTFLLIAIGTLMSINIALSIFNKVKEKKIEILTISRDAERLYRKRIVSENEALYKSHYKLLKRVENEKQNYEAAKDTSYSNVPFNIAYNYVTKYLSTR